MTRDLVSALFWLAIAIFAVVEGIQLNLGTLNRPGPGFFPFGAGVVLAALSLALIANVLKRPARDSIAGLRSTKLLIVAAALLGYLLLLETLGFVIVTCLFLFLLFRLERRSWMFSAVSALLGALASYGLFQLWLKTQLPVGPFGF
jgi:hypothetical protein